MRIAGAALSVGVFIATASAAPLSALDPKDGVLLPQPEAKVLLNQCSREDPKGFSGFWSPSTNQIRDLEARLPIALSKTHDARDTAVRAYMVRLPKDQRANALRRSSVGRHDTDFIRQYAGVTLAGKKIIYVNALPRRQADNPALPPQFKPDWRHKALVICDGGEAFFGVEYDPIAKAFSHFAFNGAL